MAEKLSYACGDMSIPAGVVDCSAGYNPYGTPPLALEALAHITPRMVCEYPHGEHLQHAIAEYWRPHVRLGTENIILTNGSIDGIYLVNSAFCAPKAAVMAFSPQFSDYTTHAKFMDIEYRPVSLRAEADYRIEPEALISKIDDNLSLIYLDNPNNPTGQNIPIDALRAILEKAAEHDVCVISDEAYGDFMEEEKSAAVFLNTYHNLIVLRTFSKGLGLAGLRAGYILSSEDICAELNKLSNPYLVSQPARMAAIAALADTGFIRNCRAAITKSKESLRGALREKLHMSYTLDSCPIVLLSHTDCNIDLEEEFKRRGVLTYSGVSFDGLGKNTVRLRMPHEKECEAVYAAIRDIDR